MIRRGVSAAVLACVCLAPAGVAGVQRRAEPFVAVGVTYRSDFPPSDRILADLQAIRREGFNTIKIVVRWADIEPVRGAYGLERLEALLESAATADLKVVTQIDTRALPDWVLERYPDGRFVQAGTVISQPQPRHEICLDHPGVRADVVALVKAVTERASRHGAWYALDVGSDLSPGQCSCTHSKQRFAEWMRNNGTLLKTNAVAASPERAFVAVRMQEDLKLLVDASSGRNGRLVTSHTSMPSVLRPRAPFAQSDWSMATTVDQYGAAMRARPSGRRVTTALGLDGVRSATGDRGWWLFDDDGDATVRVADAELRLQAWTAVSRGARAVMFAEPSDSAAAFARVLTRNPALFAPLRPRPSAIAIAYNPGADDGAIERRVETYGALLARNIAVDVIHDDEIAAGKASGYRAIVQEALTPSPQVYPTLKAYAAARGTLLGGAGVTVEQIVDGAKAAGVVADVRIDGGDGTIEARFLESSDVIMLIALNRSDDSHRVTLTFTPDTQEAIWQNLETGAAVNFVAGPSGPTYTHRFAPRDTLVLMIRKSIK